MAAFHPEFILLDLGVSSRQLDEADRGFTFRPSAPLDMRMGDDGPDRGRRSSTQADEAELARVFHEYGDERQARRLAREIVRRRGRQPFAISDDLVNAIRATLGPRAGPVRVRAAVPGGADRGQRRAGRPRPRAARVPRRARAGRPPRGHHVSFGRGPAGEAGVPRVGRACICPPRQPICTCRGRPLGRLVPRKPIVPEPDEVAANPRARSAHLRIFQAGDAS